MKRTALIILTAIYLLSCLGMSVNRFYCCGKLASVTLIFGSADKAGKLAGKNNCCKNVKQGFKIRDTHVSVAPFAFSTQLPVILPSFPNYTAIISLEEFPLNIGYHSNAPPGNSIIPIYTRVCAYRI